MRSPRVLVVEDEWVVALAFQSHLEQIGCEVLGVARDADTAVDMARTLHPDVVLMDIGLAGSDGVEAIRGIMEEAPTRVIVVTAYGGERVEKALAAGARLALTKPIAQEQLARAIAAVMEKP